jgi:hypothetical protein
VPPHRDHVRVAEIDCYDSRLAGSPLTESNELIVRRALQACSKHLSFAKTRRRRTLVAANLHHHPPIQRHGKGRARYD